LAKILIIEDNEQNRYLCSFILKSHRHDIVEATSGREGVERARNTLPDLIILDIQLPEMDGYAVARELKNDPATGRIPIVAVTSYAMAGDRERTLASGCEGYIEKPINPETFMQEIANHLPLQTREKE
jgi:two-component system, cell cycle response regulator DivK